MEYTIDTLELLFAKHAGLFDLGGGGGGGELLPFNILIYTEIYNVS